MRPETCIGGTLRQQRQTRDTLSAIRDAIQPLANAFLADFPTKEDRRRFIETARLSLAYNDAFKSSMPDRRRRALLTGPIATDAQEQELVRWLCLVAAALTKQVQDHPTATGSIPAPLRRQVQFVSLIWKGFDPDIRKDELTTVERDLHNLYNAATAVEQRDKGRDARQKHLDTKQANDKRLQGGVGGARAALKNPPPPQNARARLTLLRIPARDRIWKSAAALIRWAQRRKIVI